MLLDADGAGFEADQGIKDGQDVAAVFNHAVETMAEAGLAFGLAVPFGQDMGGDFNIAPEFSGGVAAEEKAIKECGFALGVLQFPQGFVGDGGSVQHRKRQFTESQPKVKGAGQVSGRHPVKLSQKGRSLLLT